MFRRVARGSWLFGFIFVLCANLGFVYRNIGRRKRYSSLWCTADIKPKMAFNIGAGISHLLDFAAEQRGDGICEMKQQVVNIIKGSKQGAFVIDVECVLLNSTGQVPDLLRRLLWEIKLVGFTIYAISTSSNAEVEGMFPAEENPFKRIYSGQREHHHDIFLRIYQRQRERGVIFFRMSITDDVCA